MFKLNLPKGNCYLIAFEGKYVKKVNLSEFTPNRIKYFRNTHLKVIFEAFGKHFKSDFPKSKESNYKLGRRIVIQECAKFKGQPVISHREIKRLERSFKVNGKYVIYCPYQLTIIIEAIAILTKQVETAKMQCELLGKENNEDGNCIKLLVPAHYFTVSKHLDVMANEMETKYENNRFYKGKKRVSKLRQLNKDVTNFKKNCL